MIGGAMLALWGTLLTLARVPDPSAAAVVARTVASGFHQGLLMVAGIVIADAVLVLAAVSSLVVIIQPPCAGHKALPRVNFPVIRTMRWAGQ